MISSTLHQSMLALAFVWIAQLASLASCRQQPAWVSTNVLTAPTSLIRAKNRNLSLELAEFLRGGASDDDDDEASSDEGEASDESDDESSPDESEEEDSSDKESDADSDDDEDEEEYDVEEEDEETEESDAVVRRSASKKSKKSTKYVEPYFMPPSMQIYTTLGSLFLSSKVDLFDPKVVKIVRFLFILQTVLQQLFVFYVRIQAKANNDRTPVQVKNPLSGMLESQLKDTNDMVKGMASSFLSSSSTVLEYDIKQANSLQGGVVFNLVFMWLLHFKFNQVQPLIMQIVMGIINLIYSPLFQVYVLGRNLERPFKQPPNPMAEAQKRAQETAEKAKAEAEAAAKDEATNPESSSEETNAETKEEGEDEESEADSDDADEGDEDSDDNIDDDSSDDE